MARIIYPLYYKMQFRQRLSTRARLDIINTKLIKFFRTQREFKGLAAQVHSSRLNLST